MQSLHDDDDVLWLEPEYRRPAGAGFHGVDPRALSLGAITLAAVLAVPLFGALTNGDGDGGSDALRAVAVAQASTTTIAATTFAPTTALAVTADLSAPAPTHADVSGVRSGSSSYSADASAGASAPSSRSTSANQATTEPPPPPCANKYSAVAGDFWIRIANAVDVSLSEILSLNRATAETPLYPGSEVCLPDGAAPRLRPPPSRQRRWRPPPIRRRPRIRRPPRRPPRPSRRPPSPPTTEPPTTQAQEPATTADAPIPLPDQPTPSGGAVEQMIRDIWPDDLEDQALRIAWRESNYRPDVTSGSGCCLGVFQLNWESHRGWMSALGITSKDQLLDAHTNIEAAYALYQRSGGWSPWT